MSNAARTRAWIDIDLNAVRANYGTIRRAVGFGVGILPLVKADGYGLGAERIARSLDPLGPFGFGVATAREGRDLRLAGIRRPILVVTPLPEGDVEEAAASALTPAISDTDALEQWADAAQRVGHVLDFHLEIDTGMGRSGLDWRRASDWGPRVRAAVGAHLRCSGIFTHFHSADALDRSATLEQWERFHRALAVLPAFPDPPVIHGCNGVAAIRWPEFAGDVVRPGYFLYGGDPRPRESKDEAPAPVPVAALRARVSLVREVPAGTTLGYGATYTSSRSERWGTLAIGYGDGLPRALGNRGAALVRGRRVPIIGRISMDSTVVDLTALPDVVAGEIATLIGGEAGEAISLEEVADHAATIGYEVLTGLSPRLPRVEVVEDDG